MDEDISSQQGEWIHFGPEYDLPRNDPLNPTRLRQSARFNIYVAGRQINTSWTAGVITMPLSAEISVDKGFVFEISHD